MTLNYVKHELPKNELCNDYKLMTVQFSNKVTLPRTQRSRATRTGAQSTERIGKSSTAIESELHTDGYIIMCTKAASCKARSLNRNRA